MCVNGRCEMDRAVDQLILHSLEREHIQVTRLLDLMRLNLDSLNSQPSARPMRNIQRILNYLGHQISGLHCRKENVIFYAVRDTGYPGSLSWGNLENEHQQIEALLNRAAVLLGEPHEGADKDWLSAFYTLNTVLRNHIQIEEKIWFPAARQYLADADWEQVMRSIRVLQEEIKSTAEPGNTDTGSTREYQRILISAQPPRARSL